MAVPLTFTPEQDKQIVALRLGGASWPQISKELNRNESAIKNRWRTHLNPDKGYYNSSYEPKTPIRDTIVAVSDRRDWWSRYGVKHDDGHKMVLERLPERVLCFGDMQAPFQHEDSVAFLSRVVAEYKPDACVMMGDEADLNFLKKAYMTAESLGPVQELEKACEYLQEIFKIVPEAICLTSNHVDDRISYAATQGNIPSPMLRMWRDTINAPKGWVWRDYVFMGDWLFEHGQKIAKGSRTNLQEQAAKRFNKHVSIMRGHHHSELGEHVKPVWGLDFKQLRQCFTGCLMDFRKAGYTRDALMIGCVMLIKGVPHPIAMPRTESNRWTGSLVEW